MGSPPLSHPAKNAPPAPAAQESHGAIAASARAEEELNAYGPRISDIHIKDRILEGGPVKLGTGNADFPRFFSLLSTFNYMGPFIMQAYRDDEGVNIFQEQLRWVCPFLEKNF